MIHQLSCGDEAEQKAVRIAYSQLYISKNLHQDTNVIQYFT
jgi:hypothetical protein